MLSTPRTNNYSFITDRVIPATVTIMLGIGAWFIFDRASPVEVLSGTSNPTEVRPNEPLTITWNLNWIRLCPATISRVFVDFQTGLHPVDVTEATLPEEPGPTAVIRDSLIPFNMPAGPALYRMTMRFHCPFQGWIGPIEKRFPDLPFTVIK